MKYIITSFCLALTLVACAQSSQRVNVPLALSAKPAEGEAVATFAEGCFWHSEIVFQSLDGVRDAVSGYAGGNDKNPDYEKVSTGTTGHAETVQVYYDPKKITYEQLVKAFFACMDPTTKDRQGHDEGPQYRSVAFYRTAQEKAAIQQEIDRINKSGVYSRPVVTEVKGFSSFYPAEDYHQEYIAHHPENPYVANVSIPDFEHFRKTFKGARFKG